MPKSPFCVFINVKKQTEKKERKKTLLKNRDKYLSITFSKAHKVKTGDEEEVYSVAGSRDDQIRKGRITREHSIYFFRLYRDCR